MVGCVLSQLQPSEFYILSFDKGRGHRPRPFSQLRMYSSWGFILYITPCITQTPVLAANSPAEMKWRCLSMLIQHPIMISRLCVAYLITRHLYYSADTMYLRLLICQYYTFRCDNHGN